MRITFAMHAISFFTIPAKHKLSKLLLTGSALVAMSGCSVFGIESVEEAPYQLVRAEVPFEIRDYDAIVVAETRVAADAKKAGNVAFRKLFAYISGENEPGEKIAMTSPVIAESGGPDSGESIAMTAPVTYQKDGEAWRYRFVLPQDYTFDNAPRPSNQEITLIEIEPKRVAAIRYSGLATAKARSRNADALATWIETQGLDVLSEPSWAGYNSPWALPPFRRNEVLIDVSGE